jgi:hypothetical protein
MKTIIIKRIASNNDGLFGVLIEKHIKGDIPFAVTLERNYLDNQSNISSIPAGEYTCKRYHSFTFGETFQVTNVPNRDYILFHKGNTEDDSCGCILLAEMFESLNNKIAILQSSKGYKEFMTRLKGIDEFKLIIKEVF